MGKLYSRTVIVKDLPFEFKQKMFLLFNKYYENVDEEKFYKDLEAKDKSIILEDKRKILRGFSTITEIQTTNSKGTLYGVFSGDTVIESNYWGGTQLTMEFFKNVLKVKFKHPKSEVYWFLISKGFKTYLLLANNFKNYYPRFDRQTPSKHKKIINDFATHLYGELYQSKNMIIKASGNYDRLKGTVAPITSEMIKKSPKIAFFNKMNPGWVKGDELCCIGRVDFGLVTQYLSRTFKKVLIKKKT